MGYKSQEKISMVNDALTITAFILKEEITEMKAVSITAGTFAASDRKRTTSTQQNW